MIYIAVVCALLVLELIITNNRISELEESHRHTRNLADECYKFDREQIAVNKNVLELNKEVTDTLRTHEDLIKQLVIHTDGFEQK